MAVALVGVAVQSTAPMAAKAKKSCPPQPDDPSPVTVSGQSLVGRRIHRGAGSPRPGPALDLAIRRMPHRTLLGGVAGEVSLGCSHSSQHFPRIATQAFGGVDVQFFAAWIAEPEYLRPVAVWLGHSPLSHLVACLCWTVSGYAEQRLDFAEWAGDRMGCGDCDGTSVGRA